MASVTFSIRMDENIKRQFDAFCSNIGLNTTAAFNLFAHAVVREGRIPFELRVASSCPEHFDYVPEKSSSFASLRGILKNADVSREDIRSERLKHI